MLRSRRLSRLSLSVLLGLAVAGGCNKPAADTTTPGGSSGAPGAAAKDGSVVLRYKQGPAKLKEDLNFTFSMSGGGQAGAIKGDVSGLLDITDAGAGRLKLAVSFLEVRAFDMSGAMKPEAKDGKPPIDPKTKLLTATGARVIDLLGETVKDATKALPENAKKKTEGEETKDDGDMSEFSSFLGLPPELPSEGLVVGKPLKVSKEDKENLFGQMEIDVEVETTYTLIKVDTSTGKRLAELKIESETSGAKELSQGGRSMLISLDATSESTVVFNLDDQVPVRYNLEATQNFSFGSQGSGETRINFEATYSPA